ncbi:DENN domain-containing protein 11-like [Biomphalaria glabrata]|uniref:DENN domain-containing protein 11 n=1 Tax=Biomphalaria glabrata TaxID=6526 RepID=A0A9W3AV98_BIOGL|nr:DENN domain-containing protein 11-like [Biomphalaria glabrata]KAI8759431.1 protein LCHN [Biomphalaria glabrata]
MASDERLPLLNEDETRDYPLYTPKSLVPQSLGPFRDVQGDKINISASSSATTLAEHDSIIALFVVAFDTRSGNIVEWCIPEDTELDGVEFKAMPSGSHTLFSDFVYFRKDNLFGLACFEKMKVESEIERGARMKSVGILSLSYTTLYHHMQFLEKQVRHQLETPGNYSQLLAFYNDRKGILPSDETSETLKAHSLRSTPSTPSRDLVPEMKITHPAGCFNQFIKFFQEQIFVLWKFALLQRRIIFFSPPPIGVVCYRVYCACCLANHSIPNLNSIELRPHFYVNVADIEALENEVAYVACTTEKIFESKSHLYDIYVDNQNVKASTLAMKDLLKVSEGDREKLVKLNNLRSAHKFSTQDLSEEFLTNEEEIINSFFTELNERLFQTLLDISQSQDRQLTSDHMKSIGLDPTGDRAFLMELVEHYGIDVVLMVDNPCCPK